MSRSEEIIEEINSLKLYNLKFKISTIYKEEKDKSILRKNRVKIARLLLEYHKEKCN